jgi:hypothetical protein
VPRPSLDDQYAAVLDALATPDHVRDRLPWAPGPVHDEDDGAWALTLSRDDYVALYARHYAYGVASGIPSCCSHAYAAAQPIIGVTYGRRSARSSRVSVGYHPCDKCLDDLEARLGAVPAGGAELDAWNAHAMTILLPRIQQPGFHATVEASVACNYCTNDPNADLCETCVEKLSHIIGDSDWGEFCATCGCETHGVQDWLAARDQLAS